MNVVSYYTALGYRLAGTEQSDTFFGAAGN